MPPKKIKPEIEKIEYLNVPLKKGYRYATQDEAIKANMILFWGKYKVPIDILEANKQYIKIPTRVDRAKEFRYNERMEGVKITRRKLDEEGEPTVKAKVESKTKRLPHQKQYIRNHKYTKADLPYLQKFYDLVGKMMDNENISDKENDELMDIEEEIINIIDKLKSEPEEEEEPEVIAKNPKQGDIDKANKRIDAIAREMREQTQNPTDKSKTIIQGLAKEKNDLFSEILKLSQWTPPKKKGRSINTVQNKSPRAIGGKFTAEHGRGNPQQPYFYWAFGKRKPVVRTIWRDPTPQEAINNNKVSLYGFKKIPEDIDKLGQATGHAGNIKDMTKAQLEILLMKLNGRRKGGAKEFQKIGILLDNTDDPVQIEKYKAEMHSINEADYEIAKMRLNVANAINKIDGKPKIRQIDYSPNKYVKSEQEIVKPHKAYVKQTTSAIKTPEKQEEKFENIEIVNNTSPKSNIYHVFTNDAGELRIPSRYFEDNNLLKTKYASKLRLQNVLLHPKHYQPQDISKFFYETTGKKVTGKGLAGGKINATKFFNHVGSTLAYAGKQIEKGFQSGSNYVSNVIHGKDDYLPPVKQIINKYANNIITGVTVGRAPVPGAITGALNLTSGGTFQEGMNKQPYDKLFHLFLYLTLDNGAKLLFEKNATINSAVNPPLPANTETLLITPSNNKTNVQTFLQNGQNKMGSSYFVYDPHYNNCQDFIIGLLTGNGWGTQEDYKWIKQDTGQLFANNKTLGTVAKGVTNFGGVVDRVFKGVGLKEAREYQEALKRYRNPPPQPSQSEEGINIMRRREHIQSILFKRPTDLKDAKEWLKEHKFKRDVDITPKHYRFRQEDPNPMFYNYITKKITDGLEFIIGYKK